MSFLPTAMHPGRYPLQGPGQPHHLNMTFGHNKFESLGQFEGKKMWFLGETVKKVSVFFVYSICENLC